MSAATLWRPCGFDIALMVWGYDLAGDASEVGAMTAETPTHLRWDEDEAYLARFDRWHGSQRMPIPEWWALPWVVDLMSHAGRTAD